MFGRVAGKVAANAVKSGDTSEKSLKKYEEDWKKSIQSKISSASKVQERWIGLSDKEWDNEIEIIKELTPDEFIDFIKADFGISNIVRLATHHPKMVVRQLFNIIKSTKSKEKKSK
jgi:digeranylgeranylglycerophospholipid reductase